jgi:hypothetical protein
MDQPSVLAVISPEEDAFAEGEVSVVVNALDLEDGSANLQVEMSVDGGGWAPLSFDGTTEYYETIWDTAGMMPGVVDLDVRVIDSADHEVTSTVSVVVAGIPTGVRLEHVAAQSAALPSPLWLFPLLAIFSFAAMRCQGRSSAVQKTGDRRHPL